jgi:hypothetical protein
VNAFVQTLRNRFHRPVSTKLVDSGIAGHWQIIVTAPGQAPVDISMFRGLPTQLGQFGFDDPFDENTFSFTLPSVTIFDQRGSGDLAWCVKDANVDLVWNGDIPPGYPQDSFSWEGALTSFDPTSAQLSVSCSGAMRQVDLYLAKPGASSPGVPTFASARCASSGRPGGRRCSPPRQRPPRAT